MALSNFTYSIREAAHHFKRNWSTVLGAIVTIFLSLFVIGLFVMGSVMLDNMMGNVEDRVIVQAFLSDSASQQDVDALSEQVKGWQNVESVSYKSKDDALKEYKETMMSKNASDAIAALDGQNPVPASLVIKMHDPQQVQGLVDELTKSDAFKKVADKPDDLMSSVQYGQQVVEKLFSLSKYMRIIAVVLVALLIFVAFVFINNTIRLAINARRREIAIERLVGASNGFIRGPFLMEGALESLIGSILAVGALQAILSFLWPHLQSSLSFLPLAIPQVVVWTTYGLLILLGVLIGILGSALAMRRYLKV